MAGGNTISYLYERIARGFETDIAYELARLSICNGELGETEKWSQYYERAEQMMKKVEKKQKNP